MSWPRHLLRTLSKPSRSNPPIFISTAIVFTLARSWFVPKTARNAYRSQPEYISIEAKCQVAQVLSDSLSEQLT